MAAKRRRKPHDPAAELARQERSRRAEEAQMRASGIDPKFARWGEEPLDEGRIAAFRRQGFEVVRADSAAAKDVGQSTIAIDHRGRQVRASHKADIWQQLHSRGGLTRDQLNAVRNLQDLMARRAGVGGRDEDKATTQVRVDDCRDPCLISDRMLEAGYEMDLTLRLVGPPSQRLLTALLWPSVLCEPYDWREIVTRHTGETIPSAQSVPLRIAAQALLDVRADVLKELKRRKEARRDAARAADERTDPQGLALA